MKQWKTDIYLALGVIVFCVVCFLETLTIKKSSIQYPIAQADVYVKMWLGIMAFLALLLILRSIRKKDDKIVPAMWSAANILTIVITIVYLLIIKTVGFIADTFVFLIVLGMAYTYFKNDKSFGGRKWWKELINWVIYSAITTTILYFVFYKVLHVVLPMGKIF